MSAQSAPTVLVVEDQLFLLRMICAALEIKGIHVLSARNGIEALDQLAEHHVDLILTDWNMPLMGGRELISKVQDLNDSRKPPIVVMSCEACPDRSRIDRKSFTAWLRKPCRISEMQRTVMETIATAPAHLSS